MSEGRSSLPDVIWTIGHSNRPIEEFLELLAIHRIELVADVRKMPGSRANPQFGGAALENSLREAAIGYVHLPGLGGLPAAALRAPIPDGATLRFAPLPIIC